MKKIVSFLCALTMILSVFSRFTITVSANQYDLTVTRDSDAAKFTVTTEKDAIQGVIIHAAYDGAVLTGIEAKKFDITSAAGADIEFTKEYKEGDRLFAWDSLAGMKPYTFNLAEVMTPTVAPIPVYTVTGRFVDGNGESVTNADVTINDTTVKTDENGNFTFTDIPEGVYSIVTHYEGIKVTETITVPTSGDFVLTLTIEPTLEPTTAPSVESTVEPTAAPSVEPTVEPTAAPSAKPIVKPTTTPRVKPTVKPTTTPSAEPTVEPTKTQLPKPSFTNQDGTIKTYDTLTVNLGTGVTAEDVDIQWSYKGDEDQIWTDIDGAAAITLTVPQEAKGKKIKITVTAKEASSFIGREEAVSANLVQAKTHTVTFRDYGTDGTDGAILKTMNVDKNTAYTALALPSPDPSKGTGYYFAGWDNGTDKFKVNNYGTNDDFSGGNWTDSMKTITADTTFIAVYAVNYGFAGGEHGTAALNSGGVLGMDMSLKASAPSDIENGYAFTGWKSSADGEVYATDNLPALTAPVTYTAQYAKISTISITAPHAGGYAYNAGSEGSISAFDDNRTIENVQETEIVTVIANEVAHYTPALTVAKESGGTVTPALDEEYTGSGTRWTFEMPNEDVTVSVEYSPETYKITVPDKTENNGTVRVYGVTKNGSDYAKNDEFTELEEIPYGTLFVVLADPADDDYMLDGSVSVKDAGNGELETITDEILGTVYTVGTKNITITAGFILKPGLAAVRIKFSDDAAALKAVVSSAIDVQSYQWYGIVHSSFGTFENLLSGETSDTLRLNDNTSGTYRVRITDRDGAEINSEGFMIGITDEGTDLYTVNFGNGAANQIYSFSNDDVTVEVHLGDNDEISPNGIYYSDKSVGNSADAAADSISASNRYILVTPTYNCNFSISASFIGADNNNRILYYDYGILNGGEPDLTKGMKNDNGVDEVKILVSDISENTGSRSFRMLTDHTYAIYMYQNPVTITSLSIEME